MSKLPKYTVTYFHYRWLAEPIRFLLSYVDEEFEDVRLSEEEWEKDPKMGENYPYAKLPCLEERQENGSIVLSQSFAILRYLSRKYQLAGSTPLEAAKCDEYADCLKDTLKEVESMWGADEKKKLEIKTSLLSKTFPRYFAVIEEALKKKKGSDKEKFPLPLVGKSITWVDFLLANYTEIFELFLSEQANLKDETGRPTILDDYPTIKEHQRMVMDLENIKKWIAKRPETKY